jgi:hypothetical protein
MSNQTEHEEDYELDEELDEHHEDENHDGEEKKEDDNPDEQEHDERTGDHDEEREAIQARRRKERQDRKQRRKEYEDGLKREIAAARQQNQILEERLASVEKKTTSSELMQLDQAISELNNQALFYKNQVADASTRQDGMAVADATERMIEARNKAVQLQTIKQNYSKQQVNQPRGLDTRAQELGQRWLSSNTWLNMHNTDADTQLVKDIDNQIAKEGFVPSTEAYWDELTARVNKYLPHKANGNRMQSSNNKESRNKTVVTGSGRESSSSGTNTFRLSPDRAKALADAGYEPGTPEYAKMVKRYRAYDTDNRKN